MGTTHASKLERWLGTEIVESISSNNRLWYGPPIAIAGTPGAVYSTGGGDFCGPIKGGGFASLADFVWERSKRIARNVNKKQRSQMNMGFTSLSDLISEATTGGKRQDVWFSKTGTIGTSGAFASLWAVGSYPAAGSAPATRPGGAVPTSATTGALPFNNAAGGDTLHLTTFQCMASGAPNTLILYDRTFHAGTIQFNTTTSAQSVTGVPNRYATTTSPGTFATIEVTTALGATPANLTLQYTDQAGNTAENAPAVALTTSAAANRIPLPQWFIPLNAGDTGLRTVTNLTVSALMGGGIGNVVQGKVLAFIPQPVAGSIVVMDGINSAFNLVRILDDACLSFIELKAVSLATTYTGTQVMVSG